MAVDTKTAPKQGSDPASIGIGDNVDDHVQHVETKQTDDEAFQKMPKMEQVDEFGAHAKTDPKEIALVKKLDRYILVRD